MKYGEVGVLFHNSGHDISLRRRWVGFFMCAAGLENVADLRPHNYAD